MATGTPQGTIYRHWEIEGDTTFELLMEKGLDKKLTIIRHKSGNFLSKIDKGKMIGNLEPKWAYEHFYPQTITATLANLNGGATAGTLTFSGTLFGKTIDSNLVSRLIRTDTILRRDKADRTPQIMKVTSLNGLVANVESYGNTTLEAASSKVFDITGSPWSDTRDAEDPRALTQETRKCGIRRFSEVFEITETAKNVDYELINDPLADGLNKLLMKLNNEHNMAAILEYPYHDGTAYRFSTYTDTPTLAGLDFWPQYVQSEVANTDIYVDNGGAKLAFITLNNLAHKLEETEDANLNEGRWAIMVHPMTRRYMNTYKESFQVTDKQTRKIGWNIDDSLILDNGKEIGIITDWYCPKSRCYMLDLSQFTWGYFKGGNPKRHKIPVQAGTYERWQITFNTYGVKVSNPRQIGLIYGLSDTYTG